jgi:hypothetical protein
LGQFPVALFLDFVDLLFLLSLGNKVIGDLCLSFNLGAQFPDKDFLGC